MSGVQSQFRIFPSSLNLHLDSAGAAFPHKGKSYSVEYLGGPVVKFVFRYRPIGELWLVCVITVSAHFIEIC